MLSAADAAHRTDSVDTVKQLFETAALRLSEGHGQGLQTRYTHLANTVVTKGDHVEAGQSLGFPGTTENSVSPLLHFEVIRDGERVHPLAYLP